MQDCKSAGRLIGTGMLISFAVGMVSNFKLQTDLFAEGGLLVNAATNIDKIGLIALLGLIASLISAFMAALLANLLRHRSPVMSSFYFAIVLAGLAISVVEYSSLFAFNRLSEAYLASESHAMSAFDASNAALSGFRNGVHFLDKLLGGIGILVLFAIFYRLRLLPRLLAGFGILAVLSQIFAVGRAVFGYEVIYAMLAPISLAFMATIVWLLVKGFAQAPKETLPHPDHVPLAGHELGQR